MRRPRCSGSRSGCATGIDNSSAIAGRPITSVPNIFITKDFRPSALESPCPEVSSAPSLLLLASSA